jgi:hypothetical protein
MQHLHSPGLLPLKPMDEAGLSAIITNYLKGINKSLPDQNTIQKIIATLKSIDPEGRRPLYLLFLADAWALQGEKILIWDRSKLLSWIHQNELKRIRLICTQKSKLNIKAFKSSCYLLTIATAIEYLPLTKAKKSYIPIKKALNTLKKYTESNGIKLSHWFTSLAEYDIAKAEIKALQPDLMGEYFVLHVFKDLDDPLAPEELSNLIAYCWNYPERFTRFLYKCLRDYPEETVLYQAMFYDTNKKIIQKWQTLLWAAATALDEIKPDTFIEKLRISSESPSATPEIVLRYAMGLYNYSFEQPVEAIPETLSKLQGLSESPSATPEIVLRYAMGLYNYSFEQPVEAIPETLAKLQGLSESPSATPEIVLQYAKGLYNYSNKQPVEAIPETLGKLQGLAESPSATPEIVLAYAKGLVNYTNKQPVEAIPETLSKLQGLSESPSATPEIVLQYAQGLVNYTNKQPLEAIPETLSKLQGLSEAPSATPEIVLEYAKGLFNYSNKQSVKAIPETLGKLQGLAESSTATPEIVLRYAMGLYNYSFKQPLEAIPETLAKLRTLAEAPSATTEIVLHYAMGLFNYSNKLPLEAIPETLAKLRALAEAPSATTEIVLVYAKGLFRFLIKTTETIKSSIREQLKALAVSYGQHPEIPMYYYAAYALEYAGIDQKPEPNEMQEAIRFLKKFIEAFPQHNYSNAIQQLLAALKEKGYDLKGA